MKKIFIVISILFSLQSFSQEIYDGSVSFPMSDTTDEAGTIYKRKGFLEAMKYHQDNETIEIYVRVKYYNNTTELRRFTVTYSTRFTISNNTFVVSATGAVVGDRNAMRLLYGVVLTPASGNTPATWRQSVFGGDSLTTPCMGQYYYLTKQFDNNNKLNQIIKNLCVVAAAEGKLN